MIGLGTDVVEIPRFREVIARTPSMVDRLFTVAEQTYAAQQHDPAPRLAVRFAAKEAVLKALGLGLGAMPLNEIEVVRDAESGRPTLLMHGRALDVANDHRVNEWKVSLSHTELIAQATVIAL